ncbi:serine/threonine-protein kinase RsbW [Gammaproteobacteria bacterium]
MSSLHLSLAGVGDLTLTLNGLDRFLQGSALPPAMIARICLVADEVLNNILSYGEASHGEAGDAGPKVEFHCEVKEGGVSLRFRDQSIPFNPLTYPVPRTDAPLDERPVGGLGIHLVSRLMDRVEYQREGDSNCLTLFKQLAH